MDTLTAIYIGLGMIAVSAALIVGYQRYLGAKSTHRRLRMLERIGLDVSKTTAVEAVLRARCERCPVDALCERWLDGEVEGGNDFCPNARTFQRLKAA